MTTQLLNKEILTSKSLNEFLRNRQLMDNIDDRYYVLREDCKNTSNFSILSNYKHLVLDIARQYDAEIVTDVMLVNIKTGQSCSIEQANKRFILCLENQARFTDMDLTFTPNTGDLLFTNSSLLEIDNNTQVETVLLIIDIREFLI